MTSLRDEAEKFLTEQFEIMSRYGEAPNISPERMEELITETERTFSRLAHSKASPPEKVAAAASAG